MPARFYQRDAELALMCAWSEYRSALLHLGTGAGKSWIAASVIKASLPHRSLYLADADELCRQPLEQISRIAGIIPALEKADSQAPLAAQVVVGSSQTLRLKRRLERFPRNHFQRIIVDEAHRGADRDKIITDYFNEALVGGLTATPFRADLRDLSKFYYHMAYSLPMVNLIGLGFAPRWCVLTLPVEIDLEGVDKAVGGEYVEEQVADKIEPYYRAIAKLYRLRAKGRHGIAFLVLKASSEKFAAICREEGIKAVHVAGDSPNREEILQTFRAGEIELLCNASLLSTGVDLPIADAFLNLRPTRSLTLYQQEAGRFMRVLPGLIDDLTEEGQAEERRKRIEGSSKPDALIMDVLWQHDMLDCAHPGHLVAKSPEEAKDIFEKSKKLLTPHDLIELSEKVVMAREKRLRQELEAAARKAKNKLVNAEYVGILLNREDLTLYDPVNRWELEPSTDKQKGILKKFGVDPDTLINKGHSHKLFNILLFRMKYKMATLRELMLIKRLHIACPKPETITKNFAASLLRSEFKRRALERKRGS